MGYASIVRTLCILFLGLLFCNSVFAIGITFENQTAGIYQLSVPGTQKKDHALVPNQKTTVYMQFGFRFTENSLGFNSKVPDKSYWPEESKITVSFHDPIYGSTSFEIKFTRDKSFDLANRQATLKGSVSLEGAPTISACLIKDNDTHFNVIIYSAVNPKPTECKTSITKLILEES